MDRTRAPRTPPAVMISIFLVPSSQLFSVGSLISAENDDAMFHFEICELL